MTKRHVMIDLETMGLRPGSVIMSIGAAVFDLDGTIGPTFYANIDGGSCIDAGLTVDPATRTWWSKQSVAARTALTQDARPLSTVAQDFGAWFKSSAGKFAWGHGAAFDLPLWDAAAHAVGMGVPWHYRDIRDTRTAFDLCLFDTKTIPFVGVEHNALHDALHQIKCVAAALAGGPKLATLIRSVS